MHGTFSLSIEY